MGKMRAIVAVAVAASAVGVAGGCGGSDDSASNKAAAAESGPKVSFVSPMTGDDVMGSVTAKVMIDNFMISADHVGMAPMHGEGHLHFSLDGGKYDYPKYSGANGELAVKLGVDGMYSPSVTPEITYMNLPSGEHTLKVWLADNTHNDTGASAQTTFTVKAAPVSFVTPMTGVTEDGTITAKVALDGFRINADAVGKAPMAGEGHLHFSLDGGKYDYPMYSGANGELAVKLGVDGKYSPSVTPGITYKNVPKGEHTLRVALVDNTHNEIGDVAETTFTVK